MPPNRFESWQKAVNQEGGIILTLEDIKKDQIKSLRAAAKLYEIPFSMRAAGVSSRVDIHHHLQKLTQLEEDSLTK